MRGVIEARMINSEVDLHKLVLISVMTRFYFGIRGTDDRKFIGDWL